MRTYSSIDMIRFARFCKDRSELKPYEAIKAYNEEVKELTSKERYDNLMKALGLTEEDLTHLKTKQK